MTGEQVSDRHSVTSVEHMHLMQVDKFRVLFRAEADALYEGEPIELKAANPAYYGTRVMYQMISNGSPTLCQGVKSRGVLVDARLENLSQVTHTTLLGPSEKFGSSSAWHHPDRFVSGYSSSVPTVILACQVR